MQGATVHLSANGARVTRSPDLPLDILFQGRPAVDVASTLSQLFNLCRMAQSIAARLSLGLTQTEDATPEILRDHAARLCVTLRLSFGLAPLPAAPLTLRSLFGPIGQMPRTLRDLRQWQVADLPATALAREIDVLFPGRLATTSVLPLPHDPLAAGAFENSPAGRQSAHPLLLAIETQQGRGPLWRLMGLLADAEAALLGKLPPPSVQGQTAVVAASRGTYALCITQSGGRVTSLIRRTPTDHILAKGGALEQSLSHLHPTLAPMVLALHDPCVPVTVREVQDA